MIRIVFFIPELTGGGAEKVLCNLVNGMDQSEFDITVHTVQPCTPLKYLKDSIRCKSIIHCDSRLGRKLMNYWFRFCTEFSLTYPLYVKDNYDIEVAFLECGATKVMSASTNKKALKLAWVHCDLEKKEGIAAQAEKQKAYYRTYDKVICVSENVQDSFVRLFGNTPETVVLHNVIDESEILEKAGAFEVPQTEGAALVAVGRLTNQKGFDRLLEACSLLKRDGYKFRLRILGEGPERDNLEAQIRRDQLENCVELLGLQSNPYPYLKAADLVVCSSRYEGLSTVITEALILGKPIVTTSCTGMKELLGDSEYGLITEDSAEGIYTGIRKMLDEPELAGSYAQAAAQRGQDFSRAERVAAAEDFFCRALEEKQKE